MKQKTDKFKSQAGFTLVELLAVLAIMTLIMGALVLDFASQRGKRNLVLAKNETATNLRKVQSYMLSSKNLPTGEAVKYYIATFNSGATSYTIDAVDNNYVFHPGIETVNLPSLVSITDIKIVPNSITRSPSGKDLAPEKGGSDLLGGFIGGDSSSYKCMQIIFSAPFGKMYTNGSSTCNKSISDVLKDPVQRAALSENTAQIYFSDSNGGDQGQKAESYLEVVPITGQMTTY